MKSTPSTAGLQLAFSLVLLVGGFALLIHATKLDLQGQITATGASASHQPTIWALLLLVCGTMLGAFGLYRLAAGVDGTASEGPDE